jgi:hypothetical protein
MTYTFGIVVPKGIFDRTDPRPPSVNLLATLVHVATGAAFVYGAAAIHPNSDAAPVIGAAAILGIAAAKETLVDPLLEGDSIAGGMADIAGYAGGVSLAAASLMLFRDKKARSVFDTRLQV